MSMRSTRLAGLVMVAGVAGLGLYARGDDDYYGGGVSRWEHATRAGSPWLLVGLFVILLATSLTFLVLGFIRVRRRPEPLLVPALGLYVLSLLVAWTALSVGH